VPVGNAGEVASQHAAEQWLSGRGAEEERHARLQLPCIDGAKDLGGASPRVASTNRCTRSVAAQAARAAGRRRLRLVRQSRTCETSRSVRGRRSVETRTTSNGGLASRTQFGQRARVRAIDVLAVTKLARSYGSSMAIGSLGNLEAVHVSRACGRPISSLSWERVQRRPISHRPAMPERVREASLAMGSPGT